ncbi:MAG TPA: NUDIX hydrolase [Gaiellaceae bacterium]|jgi:8-oxo-dGTP pyrophosphatase MutT (NUDIX family)
MPTDNGYVERSGNGVVVSQTGCLVGPEPEAGAVRSGMAGSVRRMAELTPWDALATEVVVDNRWYRLRRDTVRLPSGQVIDDYFVSERPDNTVVFAVTPDDKVVFVRQWKQGRRAFMTELPGGMCEPDEDPRATAARELREETGYACAELTEIGRFEPDPTKNTNSIIAYAGSVAVFVGEPRWDGQEEIEVILLPIDEVRAAIRDGRITSAGSVAAIYRALDA